MRLSEELERKLSNVIEEVFREHGYVLAGWKLKNRPTCFKWTHNKPAEKNLPAITLELTSIEKNIADQEGIYYFGKKLVE